MRVKSVIGIPGRPKIVSMPPPRRHAAPLGRCSILRARYVFPIPGVLRGGERS